MLDHRDIKSSLLTAAQEALKTVPVQAATKCQPRDPTDARHASDACQWCSVGIKAARLWPKQARVLVALVW